MAWWVALAGAPGLDRLSAELRGSGLADGHPERRSWRGGVGAAEAEDAVALAARVVDDAIIGPLFDHGHALLQD